MENEDEIGEEIEVIDVLMNDAEIDEAIAHLMELKEHKTNVQFPLASDLDLSVTDSDDEDDDENVTAEEEKNVKVEMEEVKVEVKNAEVENVNTENKMEELK